MQASGDPSAADHLSSEAAAVIQLHLLTNASCVVCRVPSLTPQVSVWNNAVIRGDLNNIRIGHVSNVQERTVIHAARWGRLITVMDDLALWSMFHAWGSNGTQRYDGSSGDGGGGSYPWHVSTVCTSAPALPSPQHTVADAWCSCVKGDVLALPDRQCRVNDSPAPTAWSRLAQLGGGVILKVCHYQPPCALPWLPAPLCRSAPSGLPAAVRVGSWVTIEPNCVLRSCIIGNYCKVGVHVGVGVWVVTHAVQPPWLNLQWLVAASGACLLAWPSTKHMCAMGVS
jgi:carbonic anhydrase/acetyltransferase-like protein (isoleucine patch superfamily)